MVVINIDTAKDSPEEIRKTIRYLQQLVGGDVSPVSSLPSPRAGPDGEFVDMMGLFGEDVTGIVSPVSPSPSTVDGSSTPFFLPDAASSSSTRKPSAKELLRESDTVEIDVQDAKDAYIEIVEYDE